jgi:hypothetical protein
MHVLSVPIVLEYYLRCSWSSEFLSWVFWWVLTPSGRCRNVISNRSRQSLVPCQNVCIPSPCTVCSSSLSTRVTNYFVCRTSESPRAKHLCASQSFLLLLPAVTSSLSMVSRYMSFGYTRSFKVPRCRLPVSAVCLFPHQKLSPSLSAYHWKQLCSLKTICLVCFWTTSRLICCFSIQCDFLSSLLHNTLPATLWLGTWAHNTRHAIRCFQQKRWDKRSLLCTVQRQSSTMRNRSSSRFVWR